MSSRIVIGIQSGNPFVVEAPKSTRIIIHDYDMDMYNVNDLRDGETLVEEHVNGDKERYIEYVLQQGR